MIIGAGRMGRRHVDVVRRVGLEMAGIADASREALAQASSEGRLPETLLHDDAVRMLHDLRPDCVVIATTAPSHCEYTRHAVEAGARFVLCEKPMATSLARCDEMIDLCRRHGVSLAINHQMRFMEQYTRPRHLLESEALGGLRSINVVAGNFGLAMNGTHYFEMFRYMTGASAVEVSAWFSPEVVPNPRGPQFEDCAGVVRAVTADGRRFFLDASFDQGHGVQVTYAARAGMIWVDELAGKMRVVARRAEYRELPTTRYGMPWEEESTSVAPADVIAPSQAVLRALVEGKNHPSGEDGRLAVAVLVAAHVSHASGGVPIRLDDAALPVDRTFAWA